MGTLKRNQIDDAASKLEEAAAELQVQARVIKDARDSQDFQEGIENAQKLLDSLRGVLQQN